MVSYSELFYSQMRGSNMKSAEVIVPIALAYVPAKMMVDVGCGEGLWAGVFAKYGVDSYGVDGSWVQIDKLQIPHTHFFAKDLEKPFALDKGFDLAVSLEVAEHLTSGAADSFVRSIVAMAPVILFSAAIPLQGGSRHINEQWPRYWTDIFKKYGYIPVDCIRRKVWDDERVSFFYAQNIVFFVKESTLSQYPKLKAEVEAGNGSIPAFVHPYMYLYYAERWRMLVPYLGLIPVPVLHLAKRLIGALRLKRNNR
jgi:SAM-dependent methyltransferase